MPSPGGRVPLKRPERPQDENTPVRVKRRRSLAGTQVALTEHEDVIPHQVSPHWGEKKKKIQNKWTYQ